MRKFFIVLSAASFSVVPMLNAKSRACGSAQTKVIETQTRCMEKGGISISEEAEGDPLVACLESKRVQNRCGPDGNLTRLRAFQHWMKQLKEFETFCSSGGGSFYYEDPNFVEPTNESYCRQAVPEVGSNMFEETLCNFKSACPPVKVSCQNSCSDAPMASLF